MRSCPVCRGEGKIEDDAVVGVLPHHPPFLKQVADLIPADVMSYTFAMVCVLALAGLIYTGISGPKTAAETPELQCSKACGGGPRFKAYTYETPYWTEPDGTKYGKHHPSVPGRCECMTPDTEPKKEETHGTQRSTNPADAGG